MGRAPCCDKATVKRGPWSLEEDAKLKDYMEKQGTGGNWIALPKKIGLNRCGKSCRLRWLNYLRLNIKHGSFSNEEDNIICSLYITIGSRWSIIAAQFPGRTDNDIKNYWNTKLKRKLLGKQRKINQRAKSARSLKQEMKRKSEDLLINNAIDTYPQLQEAAPQVKDQTFFESFPLELGATIHDVDHKHLSNKENNHYLHCSSDISCAYSFQGYNKSPGELDEIPFTDSQRFDGLMEGLSGVEMVNASESATWKALFCPLLWDLILNYGKKLCHKIAHLDRQGTWV